MVEAFTEAVNFPEDKINQPNKPNYCRLPCGSWQFLENHGLIFYRSIRI